jgi:hypothetical protein
VVTAAILSAVVVAIGYAAVWFLLPGPSKPLVLKEGIAMFGLFVLAAQAIERLIDPFTAFDGWMKEAIKTRDTKCAAAKSNPTDDTAAAAAASQATVDEKKMGRAFFWWAVATVIGLIVSRALGLYIAGAVVDTNGGVPPEWLDLLITGLILGGGTKPLHDLTSQLEKSKESAKTPEGLTSTT